MINKFQIRLQLLINWSTTGREALEENSGGSLQEASFYRSALGAGGAVYRQGVPWEFI